jgi:hypothetical protein
MDAILQVILLFYFNNFAILQRISTLEGEQALRIEQRLAEHERVLAEELKLIESY